MKNRSLGFGNSSDIWRSSFANVFLYFAFTIDV